MDRQVPPRVGTLLRRHRIAAALSQEALAERAGVSARAISDLERGIHRVPRLETLRLLAEALRLSETDRAALLAIAHPAVLGGGDIAAVPSPAGSPPVPVPQLIGRTAEAKFTQPRTRYARSGDLNIAYQEFGAGDTDLVFVPGYISHVEHAWKLTEMATFLRRLGSFSRVLLFDKRGTGMSDRVGWISTLEERMDDIRAVMDACNSERAVVMGISEGIPLSILFAATYPNRTQSLILYGGSATYVQQPDYPWQRPREHQLQELDAEEQTLYETWGTEQSARKAIRTWGAPSLQDDAELVTWFAELMRLGASPGAEIARQRMNLEIDVRHVLPAIRVPTLVLNRTGDPDANIGEARYLASHLPGAKLEELPGIDHFAMVGDQEVLFAAIQRFLAESPEKDPDEEQENVLATLVHLASDDLGPSELAAAASLTIDRFRGSIVNAGHGGIDAVFYGPVRAVRFAHAVIDGVAARGGTVRSGIQTGEMVIGASAVSGPPVDVARWLAALACPGQLLTTNIVRDLVAGSGIRFASAPSDQTGGIPEVTQVLVVDRDSLA